MPSRPSPRSSVTILLTILAGLLAALAGILGNLATSTIPSVINPYLHFAWPALGVVVLLGIGVSIWQVRRDALPSSSPPAIPQESTPPSVVPATSQQQNTASDYHTCVLSYATEDEAFAEKLHADLQSKGVACWFAPHDLKMGDKLRDTIYEVIQSKDKLLIVLSDHAIGSIWVEEEVEAALDWEHLHKGTFRLFPVRLDDHVFQTGKGWAIATRQRYIGDFRQWQDDAIYQRALQRLLRDLHV